MRNWINLFEAKANLPEHWYEATWWLQRYVTGSLRDPDWDFGEPTHLTISTALEMIASVVGNQEAIGRPVYRYLELSKRKAKAIQETMLLPVFKLPFQSFTLDGEKALEIGQEIGSGGEIGLLISANVPPDKVMFSIRDLRKAPRSYGLGETISVIMQDWGHQDEVFIRVTEALPISTATLHKI